MGNQRREAGEEPVWIWPREHGQACLDERTGVLKPRCNQGQGENGPNRDCGICKSTKNRKIPRAALEAASRVLGRHYLASLPHYGPRRAEQSGLVRKPRLA